MPPEELITELLMAFRFFYLQKEKTHFYSILNLLSKHSVDADARKVLGIFRKQWANSLFARTMNIKFNDIEIKSGLLLDLWFNAHYFHTDEDKEKELLKLKNVFTEDFAKYMLLDSVFEAIKIIFKVHDGVKGIVNEHYNP